MNEWRERPLVLIADDDSGCLAALHEALARAGIDVVVANDGEMVLELVHGELPNLILLDMMMPRLDGLETCRRLRADPACSDVPVMFLTAHVDPQYRIRTFEVGGVDYISKPFEEAELLARVRTQLSVQSLTRALREQNARLQEEVRERTAVQSEREQLTQELLQRTEQLRSANEQLRSVNERLEHELAERKRNEQERAALQAQIIAAQTERLLELSTPLIPITKQIMVMPLIGMMDAERAQLVMETALQVVATRSADHVIIDITGVRAADASVADMLVRTNSGLRLLGARALVTGISPDVARTLIALDASLGSLVTKSTLQDGVAYALWACRRSPRHAGK